MKIVLAGTSPCPHARLSGIGRRWNLLLSQPSAASQMRLHDGLEPAAARRLRHRESDHARCIALLIGGLRVGGAPTHVSSGSSASPAAAALHSGTPGYLNRHRRVLGLSFRSRCLRAALKGAAASNSSNSDRSAGELV